MLDHEKAQFHCETRVTNSLCRHRKRLFVRIKLDSSIPIRHVRTAEQLADILTDGALTAIQWKSLMRLFDIHLPLQVEC